MSKFNLSARSSFQRDRAKFIELLGEVVTRAAEDPDGVLFLSLAAVFRRIEEFALPRRLGFSTLPFVDKWRDGADGEREHACDLSDPIGGKTYEILITTTACRDLAQAHAVASKAFRHIVATAKNWIRAITSLEEPAQYPVLPLAYLADTVDEHSRDPLYYELAILGWQLTSDPNAKQWSWSLKANEVAAIDRIHALLRYDGVGDGPLVSSVFSNDWLVETLQVLHPAAGTVLKVSLGEGGRLHDASRADLAERIGVWRDARGAALQDGPAAANPSKIIAQPPGKGSALRRAGGAPSMFDPKKDQKLIADYKSSGQRPIEFANALGIGVQELKAAQARERSRKNRST